MVSVIKQGFCSKVQPCKNRNSHSFGDYYDIHVYEDMCHDGGTFIVAILYASVNG